MSGVHVVHLCRGRDWRGGERQVRLLVRSLAPRPDVTQLIATGRHSRLGGALRLEDRAVLELPWGWAYDPRALSGLLRRLRASGASRDSLILHAHDSHALILGLVASRLLALPLVATRRSDAPPGRLWRRPDRVIAISRAVERALLAAAVPAAKIACIPSGIPFAELHAIHPTAGTSLTSIVAVGALTREKGHATLIEAFALLAARIPETRLQIVGEGPERPALQSLIDRRGLGTRAALAGEQPDVAARLAGAVVFVQPSYREALGTAVLEAMALGVPVVASRTGGLIELLGDDAGLLVPPGDAAALATALESLLADPQLRARLVAAASARVVNFYADGMADRVVEVYRSALGDH